MHTKKRMRLSAVSSAVILSAALLAGGCAIHVTDGPEDKTDSQAKSEDSSASAEEESSSKNAAVVISAAGDCTLGTDENLDESTSFPAKYEEENDPSYFFKNVQDAFANDDLTIVNLEGALTDSTDREDKDFAFKGDPSYAEILKDGSVEAADLANNHSHDYGDQGYEDTIKNVEAEGISTFGYKRYAIKEVNGVKVGLVGIYELADGVDCKDDMTDMISTVKDQGAQLVIVYFHWGVEKDTTPDDAQVELGHAAIDSGADLVLGAHPHVLQGIETYKGKNIVYSLGNFCFGGNSNPADKDTMIFQQTFTIKDGTVTDDNETKIIPCSISSDSDSNNYQPTILTGDEADRVTQKIEDLSAQITGTDSSDSDNTEDSDSGSDTSPDTDTDEENNDTDSGSGSSYGSSSDDSSGSSTSGSSSGSSNISGTQSSSGSASGSESSSGTGSSSDSDSGTESSSGTGSSSDSSSGSSSGTDSSSGTGSESSSGTGTQANIIFHDMHIAYFLPSFFLK